MSESSPRTIRERSPLFRRTGSTEKGSGADGKRQRIKSTFYLEPEDVLAIDQLQSEEFRRSGKKPERSELVSRAIQEYLGHHREG